MLFQNCTWKNILIYIGRNSSIFYCLNDIVLKILKAVFFLVLKVNLNNAGYMFNLIVGFVLICLTIVIIVPFVELINKKISFIIGR